MNNYRYNSNDLWELWHLIYNRLCESPFFLVVSCFINLPVIVSQWILASVFIFFYTCILRLTRPSLKWIMADTNQTDVHRCPKWRRRSRSASRDLRSSRQNRKGTFVNFHVWHIINLFPRETWNNLPSLNNSYPFENRKIERIKRMKYGSIKDKKRGKKKIQKLRQRGKTGWSCQRAICNRRRKRESFLWGLKRFGF